MVAEVKRQVIVRAVKLSKGLPAQGATFVFCVPHWQSQSMSTSTHPRFTAADGSQAAIFPPNCRTAAKRLINQLISLASLAICLSCLRANISRRLLSNNASWSAHADGRHGLQPYSGAHVLGALAGNPGSHPAALPRSLSHSLTPSRDLLQWLLGHSAEWLPGLQSTIPCIWAPGYSWSPFCLSRC